MLLKHVITLLKTPGEIATMKHNADPAARLCAIIVFDEEVAYRRALRTLVDMGQLADSYIDIRPIPWRIEDFCHSYHRDLAIENACAADLIIVSVTTAVELPEALRGWLLDCAPHRQDRSPLLVVALLSSCEGMDPPESPRFQFIKRTSDEAGFDFLAPAPFGRELSAKLVNVISAR
jgi:hypothetical protein